MNTEESIKLIRGRIMDEYHKHPDLDWAEIAARKLHSQWLEYFNKEKEQTALKFTKWKDEYYEKIGDDTYVQIKMLTYKLTQKEYESNFKTSEQLFNEWNNLNK